MTSTGTFSLAGVSGFDQVYLTTGNSTVTVTDTALSGGGPVTILDGASGNNKIDASGATGSGGKTLNYVAGNGSDTFTGGSENDVVHAGSGDDTINAGVGTDTIYAGIGLGTYTAGSGNDSFVYTATADSPFLAGTGGASDDTISRFLTAQDNINLHALLLSDTSVVDKGLVGNFTDTATKGYFANGGVAIEYGSGNTAQVYVDANNNGNLDSGDMMIKITGVTPGSLDHSLVV
jgi:Ca2+-binding RTX toxin-like protein